MNGICPNCESKNIGKLRYEGYFCRECCIQFRVSDGRVSSIFQVEEDGRLSSLNDLFFQSDPAGA